MRVTRIVTLRNFSFFSFAKRIFLKDLSNLVKIVEYSMAPEAYLGFFLEWPNFADIQRGSV